MSAQDTGLRLEVRPTLRVRSPRELLIFSLDDTLVDTSLYWRARDAYARALAAKTGKPEEAQPKRVYDAIPKHESVTMQDAWQAFQKEYDLSQDSDNGLYLLMVRSLRARFPSAIPGAEDLLKWAQSRFTMAMITVGEAELQQQKLAAANLGTFFKNLKAVPSKRAEDYLALMAEMGFSPRNTWVIGGSVGSDMHPEIAAGVNVIRYTPRYAKDQGAQEPAGTVFRIHDLLDARAILAKTPNSVAT